MPMEGDPTSLVKVAHLLFLSTAWGMQVWVTFVAGFVLIRGVSRHTFGLVQSKLFPFYFYAVLGCSFLNLALYAMYHLRELLSSGETLQISLFFVCMVLAAVNARWFSPTTSKVMLKMQEIEKEHGLGMEMASANDSRQNQKDAADQNFDYMFKLLIIGNSSVGKTSFLFRYADDSFTSAFVSTVGIDFKVKTVYRNEKRVKLQIWDTAGQERYRTITTAYYRGAMGFLLMYDISNQDSFNAVQDWATQIKTYSWDNAQVILVGNKCDLEDDRVIPTEDGKRLADELGFEFFEASAKENINVKQVFERLVDTICEKMNESLDANSSPTSNSKSANLSEAPSQQSSGCSC
uniref:Ras-related protein Rab-3 n=2 Tax=Geotrypetes seraphini TaxID=260995 RepID=A0A6P8P7U3_GEOSA|nr:ras-related protein Rab-3D isoform X1 [Geotrypetes seraphini]XP_033779783.1 ras-related protein Rab-3D isoform X1 [Geotrypetes seraphini]XP_033779784.1 ras-related protein Rab-3D isoform X1 [Geotrypetes seraphini]XP_033779785.1 ras-related protein Rab-3D isoform X1 [Geotrypetes seraphini]XP_033779786.1 ras-related protein Rab-3D isoform X1 [Geotrypetes seraphini]